MKTKIFGFLILLLAAIGLASSTILMKTIPQIAILDPSHVSIWRFVIAGVSFWVVTLIFQPKKILQKGIPFKFLFLGAVFGVAGFSAVFALDYLPSSLYIIILYIFPSLVVLYTLIAGKPVPRLIWLGLPLTFLGLFLTVFDFGSLLVIDPIGFLITILNALTTGTYFILSERFFQGRESKSRGTLWMLTGALVFGLLWIPFMGLRTPGSLLGWLLILILGIFGTLLPLLLINVGLQLTGAARGSVIVSLQPVFAVLFSTLFLGERLTRQQWLGGVLVVAAVILLQLSDDRHKDGHEESRNHQ